MSNSKSLATQPLAAHPVRGTAMALAAGVSNQSGAALGALAFGAIGPIGVVAVRQIFTAVVLTILIRVPYRALGASQWRPVIGLALSFSLMNICLYAAIERIGLGLAVTLEFLGPLTVALAGSRRAVDAVCALLAGAGVVLLVRPGPSTDLLGILLALIAALGWAGYILLNRSAGQRLPGLQGTAAASLCTTVLWVPVSVLWFVNHPPTLAALGLAAGCALLASVVPYALDLLALRHLSAPAFGVLTSANPIWAVLAGMLLLGQVLAPLDLLGIGLIVVGAGVHSFLATVQNSAV